MKPLLASRALFGLVALPMLLVGCGGVPLPAQKLNDVRIEVPITLDASNFFVKNSYLFDADPLFSGPINRHIKGIRISGTAELSTPATSDLVLAVHLIDDTSKCFDLLKSLGYLLCIDGGKVVGTVNIPKGERLGTVNMAGAYLTELAHAGKGHLGVHMQQGRLEEGTTLELRDMKVNSKVGLF